jgi:hypothetical protein
LDVPTSLRGYLPGTEKGNTIRVGWEPSSGQQEEDQVQEEVTEAAAQVMVVRVKHVAATFEAATQLTGDSCRGCYPNVKGKLQRLLPERTLACKAKNPLWTAREAAAKVMLKQQGAATEAAMQEMLPQETAQKAYTGNTEASEGRQLQMLLALKPWGQKRQL